MKRENPLKEKSFQLRVEAVAYSRFLRNAKYERSIVDQFIRSATAPGALVAEANNAESRLDMRHKFGIALKEAKESRYWLDLIGCTGPINSPHFERASSLLDEVTAMLVASKKTLGEKL
jgi:four helix bundle protein